MRKKEKKREEDMSVSEKMQMCVERLFSVW